jgi:hypothetical protein
MMNHVVEPGQKIQPILDTLRPGDSLRLAPGTYYERLTVRTPGLTLEGAAGVILHGGDLVPAWVPAPEVGSGVWKTTALPYPPWALTDRDGAIWRINSDTMLGIQVYGCLADGFAYLRQPPDGNYTGNIGETVQSYWDGIGALFGTRDLTTYVRYRGGDDPNTRAVRAAPIGATVLIDNVPETLLRGLTITGGENQVWLRGTDTAGTVLTDCVLWGGRRRVLVDTGAHDNLITHCELYSGSQGFHGYEPGEWDRTSAEYSVVVKAHIYNENKFCVGRTTEDDTGVYLHSGPGNIVRDCAIHTGVVGVRCESGADHLIEGNRFERMSAQSLWLIDGAQSATVWANRFEDAEHHIRIQSLQSTRARKYSIGNNTFWQPRPDSQSGKHINTSFEGVDGQAVASTAEIWVYQNSFAGGGWAVDCGRVSGSTVHTLPKLRIINNLCSSYGIASSGGNAPGVFAHNWVRRNPSYPDVEEGNVWGDGKRMWDDASPPDFVIPETPYGQSAVGMAIDVSQPFTIEGVTYPPLPGITQAPAACGIVREEDPAVAVDKLVTAVVTDLAPGSYTVNVQLLDGAGAVLAEAASAAFSVPADSPNTPQVETPVVSDHPGARREG